MSLPPASGRRVQLGGVQVKARWDVLGFTILVLVYAAVLAMSSAGLSRDARWFPLIVITVTFVLGILQVVASLNPRLSKILEPAGGLIDMNRIKAGLETVVERSSVAGDVKAGANEDAKVGSFIIEILWVAGYVLAARAVGFLAATVAYLALYLLVRRRHGLVPSVVALGGTVAFVYVVFGIVMRVPLT